MSTEAGTLELTSLEEILEQELICSNEECSRPAQWMMPCPVCNQQTVGCPGHYLQLVIQTVLFGITCAHCGTSFPPPAMELVASWRPI